MSAQAPGRRPPVQVQAFTDVTPQEQKNVKKTRKPREPVLSVCIRVILNNDDVQRMHQVRMHRRTNRFKRLDTGEADALDKLMKQLKIAEGKK